MQSTKHIFVGDAQEMYGILKVWGTWVHWGTTVQTADFLLLRRGFVDQGWLEHLVP